jgi:DNA-binding LacI/PurR family transcriptional regulator
VNEIINNSVAVRFFNSIRNGRSGIPQPISIVGMNNIELQMIFHLERSSQAPSYLLFYSFYEAPAGWGF